MFSTSSFSILFCSSILNMISDMLVSSTIPPITSSLRMKWTWGQDREKLFIYFHLNNLVHVEDEIQLTDVLEALVQSLHKDLDEVQDAELWLRAVHTEDEVESGVVSVYELVVGASDQTAALQKVANIVVPLGDQLEGLLDYLLLLWFIL